MDIESWQPSGEILPGLPEVPVRNPDWVLEELLPSRSWNFVQGGAPLGFHQGASSKRRNWMFMAWSIFAAVVDLLMAFSLTCFFAAIFIALTGLSAHEVSQFFRASFKSGAVLCFLSVFASYLLFLRVFAGCTLGEWACGIRLGEPRHRMSHDYTSRVMQRFFVVAVTGGLILPVLSLAFGFDLAGRMSGLPLVQHYSR